MLIVGAKGFAKELLEIFHQKGETAGLCFYDDVSPNFPDVLYGEFKVVKSEAEAQNYFRNTDKRFTMGIGNPVLRQKLQRKFTELGGEFTTTQSPFAEIGSFGIDIGEGCNILGGVKISNDVKIGKGTMIYYNSVITHDVEIGEFCEISPSVNILGRAKIGNFVQIGTGSIIFPDVEIGDYAIIAAGSVVRNSVPRNVMVAGAPAVIKKHL